MSVGARPSQFFCIVLEDAPSRDLRKQITQSGSITAKDGSWDITHFLSLSESVIEGGDVGSLTNVLVTFEETLVSICHTSSFAIDHPSIPQTLCRLAAASAPGMLNACSIWHLPPVNPLDTSRPPSEPNPSGPPLPMIMPDEKYAC
jgi:hypothetical protein